MKGNLLKLYQKPKIFRLRRAVGTAHQFKLYKSTISTGNFLKTSSFLPFFTRREAPGFFLNLLFYHFSGFSSGGFFKPFLPKLKKKNWLWSLVASGHGTYNGETYADILTAIRTEMGCEP